MWKQISSDIRKHYYDPKFHGINFDASIKNTEEAIRKAASLNGAMSQIAVALDAFDDSHLYFIPPSRPYRHDFGWQLQMVGDNCYVMRVRPGGGAEKAGLKPGDQVLAINGFSIGKGDLHKMMYVFDTLRPQSSLRVTLRGLNGVERQAEVTAKMRALKAVADLTGSSGDGDFWELVREGDNDEHRNRIRTEELGGDLLVVKFPRFFFSNLEIDSLIKKSRKHKSVILDLRGDPGGAVETLKWLVGGLFDSEVKIGDRVGREESKPLIAKSKGDNAYAGKLLVLIDSKSASAAELLARIVQLQKRGVIIGDRSAGAVMEARMYGYKMGMDVVSFYAASITDADMIMSDGRSLEHTGVVPDDLQLPAAGDIAQGRDPVLAHAAGLAGVKLSPEEAGKLFPFEWSRE